MIEIRNKHHDWIGIIPRGWQKVKLKYAVNLINEKTTADNKLTYIGLENIQPKTGKYIESKEMILSEGNSNKFNSGDILFGKLRPYLSKCIIAEFDGKGTTELLVLRQKELVSLNRFFKYLMLNNKFIDVINSSTYGAKMPRASWDFIAEQVIPLPTLDNQYLIADYLDKKTSNIDSLIADKEKLIELLEEKRQAIITEAVTKGLNPDVKMKDSGVDWIREIPEHWDDFRIKDVCIINPSKSEIDKSEERSVSFVPMENVHSTGEVDLSITKSISEVYNGYTYFRNEDIIVAKVTPCFENGNIALLENLKNGIGFGSTEFHVLRGKMGFYNRYIYYLARSEYFMQEGVSSMYGVAGLKRIPTDYISNYKHFFPPFEEQVEIANYLNEVTTTILNLKSEIKYQIEKIKEYRQSLIYEAVTGKIDVREYENSPS